MDQLHSILYVSSATRLLTGSELQEVFTLAKGESLRLDITGLLLYYDGNFMEYIEGQEVNLHQAYHAIKRNISHHLITEIINVSVLQREFNDWSIVTQPSETPAWMDLQSFASSQQKNPSNSQESIGFSRRLLKMFWMNCLGSMRRDQ